MALSFSNEQRDRGGVEINRPIAALLGRLNSDAMLLVLLKRSLDPEGLLFGVEIGPAQGQQLAPTRASQAGRSDRRRRETSRFRRSLFSVVLDLLGAK